MCDTYCQMCKKQMCKKPFDAIPRSQEGAHLCSDCLAKTYHKQSPALEKFDRFDKFGKTVQCLAVGIEMIASLLACLALFWGAWVLISAFF